MWLTNADQHSLEIQQQLDAFCAQCKAKKLFVAIFCSGTRDLFELTEGLLLHNRVVAANEDMARAQRAM